MSGPLKVQDHNELFEAPEFREQRARKREFEKPSSAEEVQRVLEWTRTWEYREKNFAREALTINPAKACQPLGAILAAIGFEGTLPFVHGSQGCVAYFRSHFARHFKEPFPAVSSSMTEDAAVFGGLNNLIEGLENARALYRPEMIAVSTTCMAEVIGDDLNAFIRNAREKGAVPRDYPVPFAHTPSFVGSHITGWDNMMKGILSYLAEGRKGEPNGRINLLTGFDTYVGDYREIKRLLTLFETDFTLLSDLSDVLDSPATGDYRPYVGGTPLEAAADAVNARATVALQRFSTTKTRQFMAEEWGQEVVGLPMPIGVRLTDRLLQEISRLTGRPVPAGLEAERGRLLDAMADSHAYLHGKRVALAGDPDVLLGLLSFLLELGAEPVHVVCTNGSEEFEREAGELLRSSPYGQEAKVWVGKDLWHLRSLVFTEPVDLLMGSSYLKYLAREADLPLVRVGFPIFDRHHLHRYPIIGYQGSLNLLVWTVNAVLEEMDRKAPAHSFDVIR